MSAADRVAVPRSITRDSSHVAPTASSGSHIDPARIARLMATAGVVRGLLSEEDGAVVEHRPRRRQTAANSQF